MIGDVVGEPGLAALETLLPPLRRECSPRLTVVNGENAAEGFGLSEASYRRILAAGADVVTSGNHVWEKRDFWPLLESESQLLRPANYPPGTPGKGLCIVETENAPPCVVINLQGREFMGAIDCPFRAFDRLLESPELAGLEKKIIVVDFHAESAEEKEALWFYVDGRAALAAGTHTHVQSADARVLKGGTGCISDLGMTGIVDGVLGMDKGSCLNRARSQVLYKMECAKEGAPALQGALAEIDGETGRALSLRAINVRAPETSS
jgi:metallophosphoesterase (TIGR00282 family)